MNPINLPARLGRAAGKQLSGLFPAPTRAYSVLWARLGWVSRRLARSLPPASPPVLVLSVPRSGSSWVGDTLGAAQNALYLREPIVRAHLAREGGVSFFEVEPSAPPPAYRWAGDNAFAGLPTFPGSVVIYPEQWSLPERRHRRLVIKETNPLALDWLIQRYRPKIVYLVRHPAAVANSFHANGWVRHQFERRLSKQTLASEGVERFADSFWAGQGALQAVTLKRTLGLLERYDDHEIVRYEDLCLDPVAVFARLFAFCGLAWDARIEALIRERATAAGPYQAGSFDLNRNTAAMATKWKTQVSGEHIEEVKRGYLAYDPPYYGPEAWRLEEGGQLAVPTPARRPT